jgi:long-subunit fatty acid transport protein
MKKITLQIIILLLTINTFSQVIGYDDGALLFSKENIKGTARFMAMSGAFGALGGDMSAVDVNPAGLAVFNNSEATLTLNHNSIETKSDFFGTKTSSNEDNFDLSQAGSVLVFENGGEYWSKFAIGFNYTIVNDFENSYLTKGISPLTNFNTDPFLNFDADDQNDIFYENVDNQQFINLTSGSTDRVTFSLAGQYDDKTSFGFSLNTYSIDYFQQVIFNEDSNDGNGNTLHANLNQRLFVTGDGISLSLGVLTKPIDNLRLGLSYQSPTWYDLSELFQDDVEINLSNTNQAYIPDAIETVFDYQIRTTSKVTGSAAYIFNKQGLISLDYTQKLYEGIKLKPSSEFITENGNLDNDIENTSELRIGGEYRYKNISLRAGFSTETNPVKNINSNIDGYSFGIGFKFSESTSLDFSYNNTTQDKKYQFLDFVNPADIEKTSDRIVATLKIGL